MKCNAGAVMNEKSPISHAIQQVRDVPPFTDQAEAAYSCSFLYLLLSDHRKRSVEGENVEGLAVVEGCKAIQLSILHLQALHLVQHILVIHIHLA